MLTYADIVKLSEEGRRSFKAIRNDRRAVLGPILSNIDADIIELSRIRRRFARAISAYQKRTEHIKRELNALSFYIDDDIPSYSIADTQHLEDICESMKKLEREAKKLERAIDSLMESDPSYLFAMYTEEYTPGSRLSLAVSNGVPETTFEYAGHKWAVYHFMDITGSEVEILAAEWTGGEVPEHTIFEFELTDDNWYVKAANGDISCSRCGKNIRPPSWTIRTADGVFCYHCYMMTTRKNIVRVGHDYDYAEPHRERAKKIGGVIK